MEREGLRPANQGGENNGGACQRHAKVEAFRVQHRSERLCSKGRRYWDVEDNRVHGPVPLQLVPRHQAY
jgi:hypothetical protein